MGTALQCFRYSFRTALRKPRFYTYVEGYAINTWVARHPVAHAWCIDPEGFVVDTTWDEGMDGSGAKFSLGCGFVVVSRVPDVKQPARLPKLLER